jgi:hypothetical protein
LFIQDFILSMTKKPFFHVGENKKSCSAIAPP